MTMIITIKMTHSISDAEVHIPITDQQFKTFLSASSLNNDKIKDRLFSDILFRYEEANKLSEDYFDDFDFNGIFMGTIRKDRT